MDELSFQCISPYPRSSHLSTNSLCRWDSSDPERAPPPLPMNPSSPVISSSRPNTSSAIQSAHAALTEKARENGYITNAPPKRIESPERSLIKGAAHKRMQSLHTGNVRDLSSFLEGGSSFGSVKSPEKTYGRPSTPHANKDFVLESRSSEKESKHPIEFKAPERDSRFLLESKSPEKESKFPIELKSPERDSRFLLESKSPEKESRFSIELKSPERDSRFLLESRSPEKELRLPIELKAPERDSRYLLEDKSSDKQTRFSTENRALERDSKLLIEGVSAEKESRFVLNKAGEKDSIRSSTPTPGRETPTRDIPTLRPSLRRPPQSILGENTPPQSATMLALQNMAARDSGTALSNVTNGSTALVRTPQSFDAISTQILNITSIATSLQREMAQLSRRSKDNATDLVSLKEATNARDEDIRKSLRELVASISESSSRASSNVYQSGGLFIDNKAHNSPGLSTRNVKGFSLPRIPSPTSFAASLERESMMISPAASYCHDGVTNIALLEKILREMSTREGQEQLAGRLMEVAELIAKDGTSTAKKLDELLELLKDHHSQALVTQHGDGSGGGPGRNKPRNFSFDSPPVLELDFDQPKSGPITQRNATLLPHLENTGPSASRAATEIINEDVVKLIRTIKDSVAQGGGLTAEVKALVRELRGEVLGMGREIGRKLEEVDSASAKNTSEERARVVQDGLEDLKEHIDSILREHRRQSVSSIAANRVDYQEIYKAVRSAVNERQHRSPELQKEDIVQAVKDAWETYKPDIELQQFGLEREELLTCLKEGIQEYCPQEAAPGATRDEVFTAVVEGLKHFVPPQVETPASLSRDEILDAIRECLEEFEFPSAPPAEPIETGITREDMLHAVHEGLHSFDFAASTTALVRSEGDNLTRDDVLDAVNEGLHKFDFPVSSSTHDRDIGEPFSKDVVLEAVQEGLKSFDFAANTTALTRDVGGSLTRDDVLDAVVEGLHNFDFPTANAGTSRGMDDLTRDVVFDAINEGLNNFDFAATTTALTRDTGGNLTRDDVLDAVKEGLHNFDFAATTSTALTHDVGGGISKDDVYEAVKAGLDEIPQMDGFGGQIFEKLQEIIESMRIDFQAVSDEAKQNVAAHGRDTEQLLDATKDGFEKLRGDIETYVDRALDINGKDELLDRLRDSFDNLRTEVELLSSQGPESSLLAVQGELEHLRETMATSLVRGSSGADKDEILDAIRAGMTSLRTEMEQPRSLVRSDTSGDKEDILEALRIGLDGIRTGLEQSQLPPRGDSSTDKDEILEALKSGLDSIRTELEQPQSLVHGSIGPDKDEILDALKCGLESIRMDLDRPLDRTESVLSGSGEVLDALHDGLNTLRTDLEKIVNKPVDMTVNYEILDTLKLGLEGIRADIDRLKENDHDDRAVAQINDGAIIPVDNLKRNDIENLEVLITQLRLKVEALESMPPPPSQPTPGSLSKVDLETIEDMLRNVQESIAGMSTQERSVDEDGIKRDDVISIETLLRNTKAKIDEIDPEQSVKKEHLDLVELLVAETQTSVKDMAAHLDDVSKRDDVVIVEGLVRDVLGSLEEMKEKVAEESTSVEKVTKTDIEAVEAVCLEVKVAIEQMVASDISVLATKEDVKNLQGLVKEFKGRVEHQEVAIYKEFEERQAETVGVGERVTEIKCFLEEFRNALKEKLDDGASSVQSVASLLDSIREKVESHYANITDDVKDMLDIMKSEFEKSNAGVVGSKLESDEKFHQTWDRFDMRLDEKFDELMTKYDDAQTAAETKATMEEQKNREIECALLGTKAVAEDVKLLIDTLGVTLTDSVDKMDEAGKTVFSRVEDTFTRVEETHADAKAEHQLTREQVFKTIGAIDGVQSYLTEYNPTILESVKDILLIVGQHYEHSKTSAVAIQEKISEIPPPPEMPLIRELPPAPEKYDDTGVHEKLDKLVDHMHVAGKSFVQLEMLDKIHQQVMQTAAEVSVFVSNQTQRIANDHEDKEKAVEAATIALERKLAEKEHVEANVVDLREEEARLKESVAILKAEQDDLAHQKMRLSADVSSLETALRIRREELHAMEARAEGLERRILEGVIDHSRALLISKSNKGRDAMSRKRVPSHAPSAAGSIVSTSTSKASTTHSAVRMAMNGNRGVAQVAVNNSAVPSRRILSLNQITHNVPTGNFKRSHSVKTNTGAGALRKSSWGGALGHKYGDLNKENLSLQESEEDDDMSSSDGEVSETGTMRRSSHGTTIMTSTGTGMTESTIDEGTEWTGSSHSDEEDYSDDEEERDGDGEDEPSQMVLYRDGGQPVGA
jgi:hypothetical protein